LVIGHAEVGGAVFDEHVEFLERAVIQQQFQTLPRRQLALGVLAGDPPFAAALTGFFATPLQLIEDMLHGQVP